MNYKHHIIHNFPQGYPFWKKALANVLFFVFGTVIHHRKNLLNHSDCFWATQKLRKGDVVLVGGLRRLSSMVIGDVVTHAMLYAGRRAFIHAVADGVEEDSLHTVFSEYDTIVILRVKRVHSVDIQKVIQFARLQIGKPYNFEFNSQKGKFYCTELVYDAFRFAKVNIGLSLRKKRGHALLPYEYLNDYFEIIFLSHNLKWAHGKLEKDSEASSV